MKKRFLILTMATLPLVAEEFFSFIGLSTAYSTVQIDSNYHTQDTTHTNIGLRLGMQSRKWRASIALENGNKYRAFDINLDAIPFDTFLGTPKIRPYVGISSRLLHYENESISDTDGYGFGGNIGFVFYAAEHLDVDVAYRYNTISQINGVDSMQGVRIGIHYFY